MMTRDKARELVARAGKFEGERPIVPILWDLVVDGSADEEIYAIDTLFARVGRWVVWENGMGFVQAIRRRSAPEASEFLEALTADDD